MMRTLVAYVATLIAFCACDFAWLGWIAKGFYARELGGLLLARPNFAAAVAFYLVYAGGVQIFCVHPALEADSWVRAWLAGALFGFVAYATYDLTNLATLKNWPLAISVVDLLWGTLVTSAAAAAGYAAGVHIGAT
jgi:uncharacterized membrane protein